MDFDRSPIRIDEFQFGGFGGGILTEVVFWILVSFHIPGAGGHLLSSL